MFASNQQAFPCWDEPAVKSSFQLTMVVPVDRVVISNTPVIESSVRNRTNGIGQERIWKFSPTPIMSTYLLAFVVGDFDFLSADTKHGIQVN